VYLKKVRYQRPSAIVQIVQASGNHASVSSTNSSSSDSVGGSYRTPNKEKEKQQSNKIIVPAQQNNGVGPPKPLSEPDSEDIAHLMWETVRVKVLKAGTLMKIVEANYNDDSDVQVNTGFFQKSYQFFYVEL